MIVWREVHPPHSSRGQSIHCRQFPIYEFPKNILPSHCTLQTVSIYVFPKNILQSQCTLQTISHLWIPKKYFAKSVYTANNFPFMYSQIIFFQVSLLISTKNFPSRIILFCQELWYSGENNTHHPPLWVSLHCRQFPIYAFPKNILPSQCTLQTISHLYIPKKELAKSHY